MVRRCIALAAVSAAVLSQAAAQTQNLAEIKPLAGDNAFPFVMPWDASPTGTAADASFLNPKPAGANGWVVVRNGQFIETATSRRLRFFGTNVGGKAAFPSKEDAPKIARRMKVLGINLVRFHHLNNGWDLDGGTVWKRGRTFIEMDPVQLDKLDHFVFCLKRNGIYSNINLQTSREYVPELGLPETVRQIPNFQKKIDKIYPRMIELQKEYARDLLDRVNPYTKLKYKDDPAILKVEINNENSLVGWPGESPGAGLPSLPSPFKEFVEGRWNDWLTAKYKNDAGLRRAWPTVDTRTGASVVNADSAWTHENQSNGDVTFTVQDGTGSASSARTMVADIKSNPGPDWHVQMHLGGLDLKNETLYTVSFDAKASQEMAFEVASRLSKPDWRFLGLASTIKVGTDWQTYNLAWRVNGTEPNSARVGMVLGRVRGRLEIRNLQIREGQYTEGLPAGQSLAARNIQLPPADSSQRSRDYLQFLAETEAAFTETMRQYLVRDLGFTRTHIIDTQTSWGGLTSFLRERNSSFRDDHAYWNHPTFLGADWDPVNYRVDRKALVNEIGGNWGTLRALAIQRVAGLPFSVSEYNHPAPSDYQVEMLPLYAAFAAMQDWDCIYTFAWDATGTGVDNTRYANYFDMSLNPAKTAYFPMAALVFRTGLVSPLNGLAILNVGSRSWLRQLNAWDAWPLNSIDPGAQRLSMKASGPEAKPSLSMTEATARGRVMTVQTGPDGKIVRVDAPKFKAVIGFVGGQTTTVDGLSAKFNRFGAGFAALTVNPVDGRPIRSSRRVLVTLGGRVENRNMAWNAERNSVSDKWGIGPVMAEAVPASITLAVDGPRKVFVLGPDGRRGKPVPAAFQNGRLTFSMGRSVGSMWVEIVK